MSLEKIIELHLDLAKASQDEEVGKLIAVLFEKEARRFIKTKGQETFYDIPYDIVTKVVFHTTCEIHNEALKSLQDIVSYSLKKRTEPDSKDTNLDLFENSSETQNEKINLHEHIEACYSKLIQHIHLAYIQKTFIMNNIKVIEEGSKQLSNELGQAKSVIERMVKDVEGAAQVANIANHDAQAALKQALELDNSLGKNNILVNEALTEAKKVKEETKGLTIQFITILGIFATIIITVFGGISVVKAASELLISGKTSIILVSYTVGILMCSLISLVILLTSWINSVQNKNYKELDKIRWGILTAFFFISLFLGIYILSSDKFNIEKNNKNTYTQEYKLKIN